MAESATSKDTFASDFERVRDALPGAASPWLGALRRRAIETVVERGLPSVRDEDWKYTSILPILRERLEPVLPDEVKPDGAALARLLAKGCSVDDPASRIVFVDGCFQAEASRLPEGGKLTVSSLRERLASGAPSLEPRLGKYLPASLHGFAALNTAFLDDGAVIEIAAGAAIAEPFHVICVSTARANAYATHPRHVIVAGEGSSAVVVEHYVGEAAARYLANSVSEIAIGRSASLTHVRVQDDARTAYHVARMEVEQAAGSSFASFALGFGAALSRTEISVKLAGEEAECSLAGLYAIDGSRHVDHHLYVEHAAPRTRSSQLYKGVLEDSSRGVFTGRVVVKPGAQKIKATQSNPSLLLGRGAVAETRPQLEIHADDVACNHGATIGRLSEEAMFYLLSRGIDPREARRLLVSGFAAAVLDNLKPEALAAALTAAVDARIGSLGRGGES